MIIEGQHFEKNFTFFTGCSAKAPSDNMGYTTASPNDIAQMIVEEINKPADFHDVGTIGVARATAMLAELL